MHENSTLNCNAECISKMTNAPMRPKTATIERILQFSAAYNATNNDEIKNALNETYIDVENLLSRLEKAVPSGGGGAAD